MYLFIFFFQTDQRKLNFSLSKFVYYMIDYILHKAYELWNNNKNYI